MASFRLTRVDENNNLMEDEDDPGVPPNIGDKEAALREKFSKQTIKELKKLLAAKPQASLKGKKVDLIDR